MMIPGPIYDYQWPATIPHRIDMMVDQYPHNVALKDGVGRSMPYYEMANRVALIATALLQAQIGQGSKVGGFQGPGVDWICSLLAVLRLNATYVPLDPRVGIERLATIVHDCRPEMILTDASTKKDWMLLKSEGQTMDIGHIRATGHSPLCFQRCKSGFNRCHRLHKRLDRSA